MKDQDKKLVNYVKQVLEKKGRKALDLARMAVFEGSIYCEEVKKALEHFFGYWNDLARPALISICCEAVGGNSEITVPFAASMTLICGATDVHDDIIDKSKTKLAHSTIYGKFGPDIALLVGDALLFKGFLILQKANENISTNKRMHIHKTFENLLFEIGNAEALELKFRRNMNVRPEEYLSLAKMKAADIEACARIGALLGDGTEKQIRALGEFGRMLGTIIILRDDLADTVDYKEAPYRFKNESLPLPILFALRNSEVKPEISSILLKQKIGRDDVKTIYRIVQKTKAFEKVEEIIEEMYITAFSSIKDIPFNKDLITLLTVAVTF